MATNPPSKTVLIAEDEKPMARALQLKLTHVGFEVDIAANGQIAIDLMKKKKYNILLLDLIMPQVDGFGVLESMKKNNSTVPVIVLTNLSQEEDERRTKELGAKDFLVKADTAIADIVKKVQTAMQ